MLLYCRTLALSYVRLVVCGRLLAVQSDLVNTCFFNPYASQSEHKLYQVFG